MYLNYHINSIFRGYPVTQLFASKGKWTRFDNVPAKSE